MNMRLAAVVQVVVSLAYTVAHAAPIIRTQQHSFATDQPTRSLGVPGTEGAPGRALPYESTEETSHIFTRRESAPQEQLERRDLPLKASLEGMGELARNAGLPDNMAALVRGAVPIGRANPPTLAVNHARPGTAADQANERVLEQAPTAETLPLPDAADLGMRLIHLPARRLRPPRVRMEDRPFVRDLGPNQVALRGREQVHPASAGTDGARSVAPRIDFASLLHRPVPRLHDTPRPSPAARTDVQPPSTSNSHRSGASTAERSSSRSSGSVANTGHAEDSRSGEGTSSSDSTIADDADSQSSERSISNSSLGATPRPSRKDKQVVEASSSSGKIALPDTTLRIGDARAKRKRRWRIIEFGDELDLELATPSSKRGREG